MTSSQLHGKHRALNSAQPGVQADVAYSDTLLNLSISPYSMSYRNQKADDIAEAIRQVLIYDWDPIDVMDDPEWPQDEYDSYIGEIYRYLSRGESAEFIARHLCYIEENRMGLSRVPESHRLAVAVKVKAVSVALSPRD